MTLLRIAGPGDRFYPPGQVTTHGVLLLDSNNNFAPLETPNRFAITGGTEAYDLARGEIPELQSPTNDKDLEIDV